MEFNDPLVVNPQILERAIRQDVAKCLLLALSRTSAQHIHLGPPALTVSCSQTKSSADKANSRSLRMSSPNTLLANSAGLLEKCLTAIPPLSFYPFDSKRERNPVSKRSLESEAWNFL